MVVVHWVYGMVGSSGFWRYKDYEVRSCTSRRYKDSWGSKDREWEV